MDNQEFQKSVLEELKKNSEFQKSVTEELKSIKDDINGLKEEQHEFKKTTLEEFKNTREEIKLLREVQDERFNAIDDCLDELKKGQGSIKTEVKTLRKDMTTVERLTASNYADIVDLKAMKQ